MTNNTQLRADSGYVSDNRKLVYFLYLLLRDHLPAGEVESIVRSINKGSCRVDFTNGWLAEYSKNLADRLG
jgi:hypothetical protein